MATVSVAGSPTATPVCGQERAVLSVDVISHCLGFAGRPDSTFTGRAAAVRFRAVSQQWSTAFGQHLELHVLPQLTEVDLADDELTPSVRLTPFEFMLVLWHLDDGMTVTFRTDVLRSITIHAPAQHAPTPSSLSALLSRVAPHSMQLPAVRSLTLESAQWVSDADLAFLCGLMPHLTELSIIAAPRVTAIPDVVLPLGCLRMIRVKLLENDATLGQLGMRFPRLRTCELLRATEWTEEAVEALRGLPVTFLLDPNDKVLRRNAFLARLHHQCPEATGGFLEAGGDTFANTATPADIAAAWARDPDSATECCRALSVLCCRLQDPPHEEVAKAGLILRLVGVIKERDTSDAASFALCAVRGLFACGNSDSRVLSHLKRAGALDEMVRRAPQECSDEIVAVESLARLVKLRVRQLEQLRAARLARQANG